MVGRVSLTLQSDRIKSEEASDTAGRRDFLGTVSFGAMVSGLVAGYGAFVAFIGRYLFPADVGSENWQFVTTLESLRQGESLPYTTATGAKVVIARQSKGDSVDSFIALSSVCPHLGCAVHWESQNNRFFCPCHNGAFDASGKATEGPPAAANQELSAYPLKVQKGLLYIDVPSETVGGHGEA